MLRVELWVCFSCVRLRCYLILFIELRLSGGLWICLEVCGVGLRFCRLDGFVSFGVSFGVLGFQDTF